VAGEDTRLAGGGSWTGRQKNVVRTVAPVIEETGRGLGSAENQGRGLEVHCCWTGQAKSARKRLSRKRQSQTISTQKARKNYLRPINDPYGRIDHPKPGGAIAQKREEFQRKARIEENSEGTRKCNRGKYLEGEEVTTSARYCNGERKGYGGGEGEKGKGGQSCYTTSHGAKARR